MTELQLTALTTALSKVLTDTLADGYDFEIKSVDTDQKLLTVRWEGADYESVYAYTQYENGSVGDLEFVEYVDDDDDLILNESMDGDHDSAMASCGWGTDEDYGYYGDY